MLVHPCTLRRAAYVAVGSAVVAAVAFAAPASAHVTVNPDTAVQGGFGRVAFRVPTESDTASTTKLEVQLPEDAPIASVSTQPVAGWTVDVRRRTLATPLTTEDGGQITEVVAAVTWTATGDAAIKPGQFQEFPVSMGPLPKVDQIVFKTLQTYSDGTIVRWIDEPADGGKEPESPAPTLKLTAATQSAPITGSPDDSDGAALGLAIAALVLGIGGLALGGLAFLRTRRTTAP